MPTWHFVPAHTRTYYSDWTACLSAFLKKNFFYVKCNVYFGWTVNSVMWTRNVCLFQVKISVEISFFEIYNEKIHDLLASSKEKNGKKATVSSMIILCFFQSTPLSKHSSRRFTDCMLNHTHSWGEIFLHMRRDHSVHMLDRLNWLCSTSMALGLSCTFQEKQCFGHYHAVCLFQTIWMYVRILKAVSFSSVF